MTRAHVTVDMRCPLAVCGVDLAGVVVFVFFVVKENFFGIEQAVQFRRFLTLNETPETQSMAIRNTVTRSRDNSQIHRVNVGLLCGRY